MNLNQLLLNLVCIVSFSMSYAQTASKTNQFEISVGYNSGVLTNLELAPVARYNYNTLTYKFHYQRTIEKRSIFKIELNVLPKTELKTKRLAIFNTEILKTGINVSYLKQFYNKSALSIFLGLESLSNISFFYNKSDYFDFHQKFGITGHFKYRLNEKQQLTSELTIPFVLLRVTDADGTVRSFNRYQSVIWNLKYGYMLSDNFNLKLTYSFNYSRLQIPSTYRELQHQINLGITYKL